MTSLQLFHAPEQLPSVSKEWGTGRYKEEVDVFVPKAPTWQYRWVLFFLSCEIRYFDRDVLNKLSFVNCVIN